MSSRNENINIPSCVKVQFKDREEDTAYRCGRTQIPSSNTRPIFDMFMILIPKGHTQMSKV